MRRRLIVLGVVLALGAVGAVYVPRFIAFLHIGTTFAAQQTCACLFVSERKLDACVKDLGKAGELLAVKPGEKSVKVTALFGMFEGEAKAEAPFGCHPVQ